MSDAKHTPGPWNPAEIQTANVLPFAPVVATTLIAKVYSTAFGDHEQAIANARLIAAAPELLSACLELIGAGERLGWDHIAIINGKAAIAKATGETA